MERTRAKALATTVGSLTVLLLSVALFVWLLFGRTSGHIDGPTSLAAGAASTPAAAPTPAAAGIVAVQDPMTEIQLRIRQKSGNACFSNLFASRLQVPGDALDRQIAAAGGDHRWLSRDLSWIGDSEEAVKAFGASWAGQRPGALGEVWVQVTRAGVDVGLQLLETKTPAGYTVWSVVNNVAPSTECVDG